ncbi:MAG: triose-phosphate isomerase [Candidatus Omnitrophica bacterium 4484_213]|nr:MAG: triose-phosphate isomerase [Candidatus Omnitrophica bacterium 4484_213]
MRKLIIAGNWKMHKTTLEAINLVNALKRELYNIENVDIVVCPPFTVLNEVSEVIQDSNIALGGQDVFWEEEGAFTGEVSARMLKDVGCKYVVIGHSERRKYFGETDEIVGKKIRAALKEELIPFVCIGESLKQREGGETFDIVKGQIRQGFKNLGEEEFLKLIIAYEPIWAIGTGRTATPGEAEEVQGFIRRQISEIYSEETANLIRIQYGGSVKPNNIEELIRQKDIDGALVGGASLEVDSFVEIVKKSSALVRSETSDKQK